MRWRVLAVGLCLLLALPARAEEEGAHEVGIAWFPHVRQALKAAKKAGRPLWVAVHARPEGGAQTWPHHIGAWTQLYRDPRVVAASRAYSCALLQKWKVPKDQLADSPMHLVLDVDGRVLAQQSGWEPAQGEASIDAMVAFLRAGRRAFGSIAQDAPVLDERYVRRAPKIDPAEREPISLTKGAPGLRLRLRFELPTPAIDVGDKKLVARAQMKWDGHGPFDLGLIHLRPGEMLDQPIDVRFEDHPGLAPYLEKGDHRLDLELAPVRDGYPFAKGPLRVGHAIVRMGEGGGGGDGNEPPPDPPPEQPPPPQDQEPPPDDPQPPPPPPTPEEQPPEKTRVEVVEPLRPEGEKIRKDDAVVAVPDPDAGVKPPERIPLTDAAPALRRAKDRARRDTTLPEADRMLLRRYFEYLEQIARGRPK